MTSNSASTSSTPQQTKMASSNTTVEKNVLWGLIIDITLTLTLVIILAMTFLLPLYSGWDVKMGGENKSEIVRNWFWMTWMVLSLLGVAVGICLTWWGRRTQEKQWETQQKTHSNERYEKTAAMLGDKLMPVRIAGCLGLENLAGDDKNMRALCVRLLLSYLNSPYPSPREENDYQRQLRGMGQLKLEEDIQTAATSLSNIYREAYKDKERIDDEIISLPRYFLSNREKRSICFAGGNFKGENMEEANLRHAELQGANLSYVNLRGANLYGAKLHGANLRGADITKALLEEIDDLERKQILLAEWGLTEISQEMPEFDDEGKVIGEKTVKMEEGEPPTLPDHLYNEDDKDMQEWLAEPDWRWKKDKKVANRKKMALRKRIAKTYKTT